MKDMLHSSFIISLGGEKILIPCGVDWIRG